MLLLVLWLVVLSWEIFHAVAGSVVGGSKLGGSCCRSFCCWFCVDRFCRWWFYVSGFSAT